MGFQKKEIESKQKALSTFNAVSPFPQGADNRKVYECKKCKGKFFVSKDYLRAHYKRRHPGYKPTRHAEESPENQKEANSVVVNPKVGLAPSSPAKEESKPQLEGGLKDIQENLKTLSAQVALVAAASKDKPIPQNAAQAQELKSTLEEFRHMMTELKGQLSARESHDSLVLTPERSATKKTYEESPALLPDPRAAIINKDSSVAPGSKVRREPSIVQLAAKPPVIPPPQSQPAVSKPEPPPVPAEDRKIMAASPALVTPPSRNDSAIVPKEEKKVTMIPEPVHEFASPAQPQEQARPEPPREDLNPPPPVPIPVPEDQKLSGISRPQEADGAKSEVMRKAATSQFSESEISHALPQRAASTLHSRSM